LSSPAHLQQLPSGVTVLLREAHLAPVAEIQVWAQVGSADESAGEAGLAHFHEHMLFKGTESREVGEIAGAIEGAGGHVNAYTSFDVTCYHATLPREALPLGVQVLADAVQHSRFDPEEIRREIEVVLEEIRRAEDDPHSVLADGLLATVYTRHPYRRPILGTRESVASFTREQLLDFYGRWYAPPNLLVVAVGDFEAAALLAQLAQVFPGPVRGGARRQRPVEPEPRALRSRILLRPFERACLELSWPSVPLGHPDAAPLDLLAFVLGEGDSSRLVRRIQEESALADRIDASSWTPLDPGLFGITADADPAQLPQLLEATLREAEILRREPVSPAELDKARANFLASESWERESVAGMARKLGSFHVLTGDHRFEQTYLERVRTATPEDLLRVARHWLAPERLSVAAVLPEAAQAALDADAIQRSVRSGSDAARRLFQVPRPHPMREPLHAYELGGGTRLFVLPRREIPVVAARAALLGGQLAEREESAGLSSFLASMWLRGTRSRSAADFARQIERRAADIDGFSGRNSLGLTLDAMPEHLEPVLDLFAEALLFPSFAEEEIERERRETEAALARRQDHLSARVFDLFARTHFEKHPYRHPLPGTLESVRSFRRADLLAHHERLVRSENLVMAVVGDVDPDAVASAVSRRLAPLPGGSRIEQELPPEEPPPSGIRLAEELKERAQAHLVLGFRGLRLSDPGRDALEVLVQVLSGQGGRLFLELRDRRSLAYSVSAVNVEGVAPGFLAIYMGTAPEKLDPAREGILQELRRVLEEPPSQEELARARRHLIGSFAIDQQRSHQRALHLALDARYGLVPTTSWATPSASPR